MKLMGAGLRKSEQCIYRVELSAEIVGFGSKLLRGVLGLLKLCEVFGALNY
jgi:hypothetical protein